jgi:hypothetical protein
VSPFSFSFVGQHFTSDFSLAEEHIPDILTRGNSAQGKVICRDGCGTFCYQF